MRTSLLSILAAVVLAALAAPAQAQVAIPAVGQAIEISTNIAQNIRPATIGWSAWQRTLFNSYGSGTFIPDYSPAGAFVIAGTGGHQSPANCDAAIFDFEDGTWKLLLNANGVASRDGDFHVGETTGSPYYEILSATAGQIPSPPHVYLAATYIPAALGGGPKGSFLQLMDAAATYESLGGGSVHRMDLSTGLWTRATNQLITQGGPECIAVYDPATRRQYLVQQWLEQVSRLNYFDLDTKTIQLTESFPPGPSVPNAAYATAFLDPDRHLIIYQRPGQPTLAMDLDRIADGWIRLATSGTQPPVANRWAYFATDKRFYNRHDTSGQSLYRLTGPAGDWKTGTWVYDTVTIAGATMPNHREGPYGGTKHYSCFFAVPALGSLAWIAGDQDPVILLKPPLADGTDTTPPPTPAAPVTSSPTAARPTLSGTTEAGASVLIHDGVTLVATVSASSADGTWSWTPAAVLVAGSHSFTVVARDAAGNRSAASPATVVTVPTGPDTSGRASFQLLSATTGTQPFSVGLALKQGDVADMPVLDLATAQVVVKRRWNDGSVKHAIASGRAALTAGVPLTVQVSAGVSVGSTALTAADIAAALPTASVTLGSYGTVNLANLLASPVRTWISGPEAVEAHYHGALGSNPDLSVWFHVRLHQGGRIFIRAIVDHGYLDTDAAVGAGPMNLPFLSYVPSVSIGGTTVYTNGGAALNHYRHTRWMQEGWIGGDPQVTPRHDTVYLGQTRLVPNYWKRNPSSAALSSLCQEYRPYHSGMWEPEMGSGGYAPHIGLLPLWDALYCTSGADPRAYRSVLANAKALYSFPVAWSDSLTGLPVKPSDRPDWDMGGRNQGGWPFSRAGANVWDAAHHGSAGYLAYLITGDYLYLELMQHQTATVYLSAGSSHNHGTSRGFWNQTRGEAWCERTLGQLAAIGPGGDAYIEDCRVWLGNIGTNWRNASQAPNLNKLGYLWDYAIGQYSPTVGAIAPWQQHFWIQTAGFISDLQPLADMSAWNEFRDHMYQAVVGILGPAGSDSYGFAYAGAYTIQVADRSGADSADWYDSWGTVFAKTVGIPNFGNNTIQASVDRVRFSYWGNLLPAISYAVDHGAPGAAEAYNRVTAATNWAEITTDIDDVPIWIVAPRVPVVLPPGDSTPPSVAITAPAAAATAAGTVTVSASASDDVGVLAVLFLLDGVALGAEDLAAPYTIAWDSSTASNGTHLLTAVARDAAGNAATSVAVPVTVANAQPVAIVPPVASFPVLPTASTLPGGGGGSGGCGLGAASGLLLALACLAWPYAGRVLRRRGRSPMA